ncbi:MAG: glycoside hydrolase family 32 protein [Lachnospiraceae bacterium]|nr:glycoside hydrolase family 32 protein [Lachnospiraceae bacterium]
MRLSVTGAYLAVPVWTNPDNWNKYRFTVRSGDRLIYTFRIPEETEKNSGTCDYHAYLPVDDLTGGETDVEIDTDAPYPVAEGCYFTDRPIFESRRDDKAELHYHASYGSLNDPNGLIYRDGVWHMYHQHNPMNNVWGNMSWGHAVSDDLIHFRFQGDVLFPEEGGTMFSGCGIVNTPGAFSLPEEALLFYYTYAAEDEISEGDGKQRHFTQRIACSLDGGYNLRKIPDWELPVMAEENRDPKIFYHNSSSAFIMVLYLTENRFAILRSKNLVDWEKTQEMSYPPMWECPDLLELSEDKWAFMSADGYYYIGSFDGFCFTPETAMRSLYANSIPYAAQSFSGVSGRIISTAWLRTENHGENWHGLMSVPREFTLGKDGEGYYIRQSFVREAEPYIKEKEDGLFIEDDLVREEIDRGGHLLKVEQLF